MHLSLPLIITALAASVKCSVPCPTPCPTNQFCSPEGNGCIPALWGPGSDNCNATTTASPSAYGIGSWTSAAVTSLANVTVPITTASGNSSTTASPINSTTSVAYGITNSSIPPTTSVSNITYSYSTTGPTTTSVVAPAKTGGGNANTVSAVGMFVVGAQVMAGVLWHYSSF